MMMMMMAAITTNRRESQPQPLRMDVGAAAGSPRAYRALFGAERATVSVGADGWAAFVCPPGGVQVWVPEG
jgi:alpha-amylase